MAHNTEKEQLVRKWREQGIGEDILKAFEEVKREEFIDGRLKDEAYIDGPLPIGHGQTISQPTTVIFMINALELKKEDIVLEIGAGSGYNAALIARLCKKVYTVERISELVENAKKNLEKAGIKNVEIIEGDGTLGLKEKAPFDKIIITAACPHFPSPLVEQLKEGGVIIGPVGGMYDQVMVKATKVKGELVRQELGYFRFVPLIGKYGYEE
jgi:protein-L-isoaspartate(D-aspartate) O-methyltransferase